MNKYILLMVFFLSFLFLNFSLVGCHKGEETPNSYGYPEMPLKKVGSHTYVNKRGLLFSNNIPYKIKMFAIGYCSVKNNCADKKDIKELNNEVYKEIKRLNPKLATLVNTSIFRVPPSGCCLCHGDMCGDALSCYTSCCSFTCK